MYVKLSNAVNECLGGIGLNPGKCMIKVISCRNLYVGGSGVYVFYDDRQVYYVGEADDVLRRLSGEHCAVRIGGSEGVVRFLMYLLDKNFCNGLPQDWHSMNVKEREDYVKEHILKPFISKLSIYVVVCSELKDQGRHKNRKRQELEKCLREKLKPILNPP